MPPLRDTDDACDGRVAYESNAAARARDPLALRALSDAYDLEMVLEGQRLQELEMLRLAQTKRAAILRAAAARRAA